MVGDTQDTLASTVLSLQSDFHQDITRENICRDTDADATRDALAKMQYQHLDSVANFF